MSLLWTIFLRMQVLWTALEDRDSLSLQSKRQVCLLFSIIKIVSPSKAKFRLTYTWYRRFRFLMLGVPPLYCSHWVCMHHLVLFISHHGNSSSGYQGKHWYSGCWDCYRSLSLNQESHVFCQHLWNCGRLIYYLGGKAKSETLHSSWQLLCKSSELELIRPSPNESMTKAATWVDWKISYLNHSLWKVFGYSVWLIPFRTCWN